MVLNEKIFKIIEFPDTFLLKKRQASDFLFFFYLFQQYLYRGAQFSEAGLNGAVFKINLHTNLIKIEQIAFELELFKVPPSSEK